MVEKNRVPSTAFRDLREVLADPDHVFQEVPVAVEVAEAILQVSREAIPDMPGRIVAAIAIHLAVPILSRDGRIRASNLRTIW